MPQFLVYMVQAGLVRHWREFEGMIKEAPDDDALLESQGNLAMTLNVVALDKAGATKKVQNQNPGCLVLDCVETS